MNRWGEVDAYVSAYLPIAGDLEHAWARQAAVGEQQIFLKALEGLLCARLNADGQRQTGELGVGCPGVDIKGEWYLVRTGFDHAQVKLFG